MTIATILFLGWTASSQVTTKEVKISTLVAMGKDLEKCKLLQNAFDAKSANFDSLVKVNIKLFNDLERQQKERIEINNLLRELNEDYTKAVKQKKSGWIIPGMGGIIVGMVIGFVI